MIFNNICVFDFETGSKNKHKCQVLQLSAVMVNPIKCEIVPNSVFNSYIKPLSDEEAIAKGLDPISKEALEVNKIDITKLANEKEEATVWASFTEYVALFNNTKQNGVWGAPYASGYNIVGYDLPIVDRLCSKYGPWDSEWETQKLFHPLARFDVMDDIMRWTSSLRINSSNSVSMDNVRKWLGIDPKDLAHNAVRDVFDCAYILCKLLKLYKNIGPDVTFENSFANLNDKIDLEVRKYVQV